METVKSWDLLYKIWRLKYPDFNPNVKAQEPLGMMVSVTLQVWETDVPSV